MKIKLLVAFLLLHFSIGFAQQLTYKSNGRIFNDQNEKLSPKSVRQLLEAKPGILNYYNEGRSKKTVGNILLIGGTGLIVADLLKGLTADVSYPSALTYLGAAAVIVSIPVKSGYSKKIQTVVKAYNEEIAAAESPRFRIDQLAMVANGDGIGIKIGF